MQAVNGREIYTQVSMGNMWGVSVSTCMHVLLSTYSYILYTIVICVKVKQSETNYWLVSLV